MEPQRRGKIVPNVLLDTDALVALVKEDDSNHLKAVAIYQKLKTEKISFFLSPFTTAETATVLSYKLSHQSAKEFLRGMRENDLPVLALEQDSELADKWFLKQNKKGTSYFDCYNMALLDRYKKQFNAIFSFDSVYKRNGFKLLNDLDDINL